MNLEASAFKTAGPGKSGLTLTRNDVKILGKLLEKKREKTLPPKQFHTRLFKTHNSNWTPVVHKPSNDQIFNERLELIINWFDMWTGAQRCEFFNMILLHCSRNQLLYIQNWFNERVPLRHLDFTTVLPRFLSLYVFSFLDPRNLCQASIVSWHWKFLSEQDVLWMPKCLRHGWYLPFHPSPFEYGGWKHHYVACLLSLDAEAGGDGPASLAKYKSDKASAASEKRTMKLTKVDSIATRKALRLLWPDLGREILEARPPWLPPDRIPHDIEKSENALLSGFNPNDPKIHPSLLLYHTKFGTWTSQLRRSVPALVRAQLMAAARLEEHRLLGEMELECGSDVAAVPLSKSLRLESYKERRLVELKGMEAEPPVLSARITERRPDLSGGTQYPLPWTLLSATARSKKFLDHPRVVFISSRVAAAEMLVDAALSEVISLIYDYDATTLESLLHRLDQSLQGRQARSLGFFVHADDPGKIHLLRDAAVSADNFKTAPEFMYFFKMAAAHVMSASNGGHVDIFVSLCAYESGVRLLSELALHTGMAFNTPSGVSGRHHSINSEWVLTPEGVAPPFLYFSPNKLTAWMNIADHMAEACRALDDHARKYFGHNGRDIVAKVVGEAVFEATALARIGDLESVTRVLVDGIIHAASDSDGNNSLMILANYLWEFSHRKEEKTLKLDATDKVFALSYGPGQEVLPPQKEDEDVVGLKPFSGGKELGRSVEWKETLESYGGRSASAVDRRLLAAREVLSTEVEYMRTLEIIQKVFFVPCEAALAANRAIVSASNLQLIFNDVLLLLDLSSGLVSDLQMRLSAWNAQHCIGDIFVKFSMKLKAYTNFLKVYPLVLRTIEKCTEQVPLFRAFLNRHERTAASKMLTLPELLLAPSQRIADYVALLTSYQRHTPSDHADCTDVATALNRFIELNQLVQECKLRGQQERQILRVQRTIVKCPGLLEANRFFIKQVDVSGLRSPLDSVVPELRVYRHVENLGLFLFNDSLVLSKRTTKHVPFERCKEDIHVFTECCELIRLRVDDIADSKYVSNAFRMFTPKREWLCSMETLEEKLDWISVLEKTIRAAVEDID